MSLQTQISQSERSTGRLFACAVLLIFFVIAIIQLLIFFVIAIIQTMS
jgi:hypothetical protein